ncbi:SDR family NAD(P)-dependent oxidoreductase [Microbacterium sp. YY-01]|uniref:SDR family NAD(P)-dependent oxidoreductase n=1 Tax=Microbacterium sp. YY-01 TaxID=3421634 RepID=UPI003D170769
MKISGQTFVVTGAGNGIGREVTLQLLAAGASVAGVDLNAEGLEKTSVLAAASDRFSTHLVNITDRDAVETLPDAVATAHGPADALINVAGVIQKFVKVDDLPYSEIEKVMNVNFWGTMNMVKTFLPVLKTRPAAALVNVASMGAYAPVPGQAVYGASKAAVKVLSEALYAELLGTPVAVSVIFPGAIGTDIATNSGVALSSGSKNAPAYKTTSPAKAASVIIDAVIKGKYRATIGGDAALMDRLSRLRPKRATMLIAKQMSSLLG